MLVHIGLRLYVLEPSFASSGTLHASISQADCSGAEIIRGVSIKALSPALRIPCITLFVVHLGIIATVSYVCFAISPILVGLATVSSHRENTV